MGSELGNAKLSLEETLKEKPRQFSFEMAAYVLEYGSPASFGKEVNVSQSPFKTKSLNSFHLRATEIEKISEINGIHTVFVERLAISGLNAPLPTPYAELIMMRTVEQDTAISSFINAFNSRLLGISYQISKRRYLALQDHRKNCMLTRSIAAFLGEDPEKMERKLSRLSYVFWTTGKSAIGLEAIITSIFNLEAKVKQHHIFWDKRDGVILLGDRNLKLGNNSMLGKTVPLSQFGVTVEVSHKNYEILFQLLTNQESITRLKDIIKKYLGNFFYCKISVIPKSVPPLKLGCATQLSRNSWLPSSGLLDGANIFCDQTA
ncbi:MAG: type VI secretion system baseplate subunit TssG [Holosporaceae bacterium]|jgi:predicted component of type VI protein secretion system|nr:type VI secretion system baseplate subunit TssG [Holosporaceae bacterium]